MIDYITCNAFFFFFHVISFERFLDYFFDLYIRRLDFFLLVIECRGAL